MPPAVRLENAWMQFGASLRRFGLKNEDTDLWVARRSRHEALAERQPSQVKRV